MKNRKYATMVVEKYKLKEGTKAVYLLEEKTAQDITEQEYNNYISSTRFFRGLGGSEYLERECVGGRFWRMISKSPDRSIKIVRMFDFC